MGNNSFLISLLVGYFIGSVPFTQIVAKLVKGIDLRQVGSKNVGGRNTVYSVGLGWGIFAGSLDAAKGAAAVYLSEILGIPAPQMYLAGLAAIAGHNWPVWLGFKGGKGLATAIGLGLYAAAPETLIGFCVGFAILTLTKNMVYTTLGGLGTLIALTKVWERPAAVTNLFWGVFLIITAAALPNIIRTMKQPGGFRAYFAAPNEDYEKPENK